MSEPGLTLVLAPRALRDLQGIAEYLTARSPSGSRRVLANLRKSFDGLLHNPGLGVIVDGQGHRRIPVVAYPYVIYYRIAAPDLLILHIRPTSRRPIDPKAEL